MNVLTHYFRTSVDEKLCKNTHVGQQSFTRITVHACVYRERPRSYITRSYNFFYNPLHKVRYNSGTVGLKT